MENKLDSNTSSYDEINIGRLIRTIFLQSKLILFVSSLGLILSILYMSFSTKSYDVRSLIQVYDNSSSVYGSNSPTDMFLGSSSRNDVQLLVKLYKTRTNIIKIIEEFNLNLYLDSEYDLDILDFKFQNLAAGEIKNFKLIKKPNIYEIYDDDGNLLLTSEYSKLYEDESFTINIRNNPKLHNIPIEIAYQNPADLYLRFYDAFNMDTLQSTNNWMSSDGFISINFVTHDKELGKKIVDYANNLFLEKSIEFETEKARKAIEFIDNQLISLNDVLEVKKASLKSFKEKNQSVNVDLEIEAIIDSIAKLDDSLNLIDIDLAEAASLYTPTNPIFKSIDRRRQVLLDQKSAIEKRIKDLPIAEQQYIDLFRDVEISQQLYLDLASRRMGFSIMEASTIGNIRIVDEAYIGSLVNPRLSFAVFINIIFFGLGIVLALLNSYYFMRVTNPAEINDEGIKK